MKKITFATTLLAIFSCYLGMYFLHSLSFPFIYPNDIHFGSVTPYIVTGILLIAFAILTFLNKKSKLFMFLIVLQFLSSFIRLCTSPNTEDLTSASMATLILYFSLYISAFISAKCICQKDVTTTVRRLRLTTLILLLFSFFYLYNDELYVSFLSAISITDIAFLGIFSICIAISANNSCNICVISENSELPPSNNRQKNKLLEIMGLSEDFDEDFDEPQENQSMESVGSLIHKLLDAVGLIYAEEDEAEDIFEDNPDNEE